MPWIKLKIMQHKLLDLLSNRSYFFDAGLRFTCKQCGHCCTGEHGTIYVTDKEISTISSYLKITKKELIRSSLYPYKDSYSIAEDEHGNCLFYANGCRIYPVRPTQCRTYPFWFGLLRSKSHWEKAQRECPGIGQGKLYSKREILDILEANNV